MNNCRPTSPIVAGTRSERPLTILGPTASGKSSLALAVAAAVEGVELVSIDSMQVYRGMDLGTATPTPEDRAAVRHHLLDLVEPTEPFAVGEFQQRAFAAISDIRGRGGIPVLVGGTGLYLRAVVDELEIPDQYPAIREELEADDDTDALHERLRSLDPLAASRMEPNNRRRVVRALEVTMGSGRPFSSYGPGMEAYPPTSFVQVALRWPRDELYRRIALRYEQQMADGFLAETAALRAIGPSRTARQALGYRELLRHLEGECSLDEAIADAVRRTCRFARRQQRWFRRDPRIRWIDAPADTAEVLAIWDDVRSIAAE